ncbi:MAG: DUF1080 domain-containing protein [Candidatus Hinthialibacter antarcticus]|nr:DUF1080 domain-containing protein [Candidatus Hinthialibacter antarcticus]
MLRTIKTSFILTSLALILTMNAVQAADDGFAPLFNGKDLSNWEQHGGEAVYTIEDGAIVGTSVPKTSNSFLCTKKMYSDFILEVEYIVDPKLNSGIQIRSNVYDEDKVYEYKDADGKLQKKKVNAGRVHGYQVEIDPAPRAWSAGIYDEGRRGWLYNLEGDKNAKARAAFKQNEWNHYRIECKGDSLKTWINGVAAADLKDDMTPTGFIALQVHGIGDSQEKAGTQIRWRNIKIKELK